MSSPSPQPNIRRKRWSARKKTLLILMTLTVLWGGFEIVWRVTGEPAPVVNYFSKLNDLVASYQPDSEENGWETMMEVLVMFAEIEADAMDIEIEEDEALSYLDHQQLRVTPHLPDRFPREMFIARQLEERGANAALQRVADMPVISRPYAGGSTVAGILLAFTIPASARYETPLFYGRMTTLLNRFRNAEDFANPLLVNSRQQSLIRSIEEECHHVEAPLQRIEFNLHPYTVFLIMPIFALANSGCIIAISMI